MSIGVVLPSDGDVGPNVVDYLITRAEEARTTGLDGVWIPQHLDHDALSAAAVIGAKVPDIEIGTSIVPIYGRHPVAVSSQTQTAQAASHGRFTLGIGLGPRPLVEASFGVSADRPVRHLREYLTVLNSLLSTGMVSFAGETLAAHTPFPAAVAGAAPTAPILVGAMGPQMLAVTGELADGTLTYLAGPRTLAEFIVPTITAAAQKAGRSAPRIVVLLAIVVTDDVAAVTDMAHTKLDFLAGLPSYQAVLGREGLAQPADLAVIGDEDDVRSTIGQYFAAGATDIVALETGLHTEPDRRRTWTLLGELARA